MCLRKMSLFVQQNATPMTFKDSSSWVILSPIEKSIKEKIERVGTPLKDWDIKIYRGILTGYNEAFIIDETKRRELIAQDPQSAEIIRPILRGRDIKRYSHDWAGLYLITTHNGIPEKGVPKIDIEKYPTVKKHLDSYWQQIEKRADQGDTPYHLRSCAYMDDFSKPKIIYPDIMRMPRQIAALDGYPYFYFDTKNFYVEATNFMMTGRDIDLICSFLASDLGFYVFSKFFTGPQFDETGFRYKKVYLHELRVPVCNDESVKKIREQLSKLLDGKSDEKASVTINQLWCDFIGLTAEEKKTVTSHKATLLNG